MKGAGMLLMAAALEAGAQPAADLVLVNGKVWTVSESQPRAEAVACRDGRIVAAGSNADVRKWAGPSTRIIDAKGRLVLPGFNDAHVHFYSGGQDLAGVQLRDTKSQAEFRDRIAAFARKLPKGRWITGGDWDHENWSPAQLPTRQLIDAVTPDNPVFVNRLDGHMALANSLALRLAGITRDTADPPGGAIVRDEHGEPAGVLKDAAMGPVSRAIPPATRGEIAEAIHAAMRYAAENGVTSVQDMSAAPEILRVYQDLLARGELTVRIYGAQPLGSWQRLSAVGVRAAFGNEKLRIGILKGFSDGSLGSTTALLFDPYLDAPNTRGLAASDMIPESKMRDNVRSADAAGLQVAIHAIGDRANHLVLNFYEEAERADGARDRRFRIEHAQHLRRDDIARFGKLHTHRIDAAVPRDRRRPVGGEAHWAGARQGDVRVPVAARNRRGAGIRLRLAGGADGAVDGHLRGGHAPHAGWEAPGWVGTGAEDRGGGSHSRLHHGIGICRVWRKAEGFARAGQGCRFCGAVE